jgi:MFS transporter, ACS family, glucarate transporter
MASPPYSSDPWDGEPPADARPTNVRWMIFGLSCVASFLLYFHRYTWGMVKADIAEEFGWDTITLGMLDSCFLLSYSVSQVPFGILGDWFGPRVILGATIGLWSAALAGTTVATGLATMYAARFCFGLAQAGCYSSLTKVTKLWFPMSVRTTVQGWVAAFSGRAGGAASTLVLGTLLLGLLSMDWRTAIQWMAAVGVIFTGVFVWLFRNRPIEHPWSNRAEADLVTAGDPDAAVATRSRLKWRSVFRSGNMLVFLFQQFTSAFADNLFPYWIPLFLLIEKGVSYEMAGMLAALAMLGGALGGASGGMLQNSLIVRTGNRRWSRSGVGCVGKLLAAGFMGASLAFDSPFVILSFFFFVKFFSDWSQPTVWGTSTDIGGSNSATVFSTVNTVGSFAAFVAGPAMGGLIYYFSQDVAVHDETIAAQPVAASSNDDTSTTAAETRYRTLSKFEHRALVKGTVRGTVFENNRPVATFAPDADADGAFTLTPLPAASVAPLTEHSTLNVNKGELTLAWNAPPTSASIVIDYEYTQYGHGWTALFIALCGIYLASATSWLFVDCTKKLEGEVKGDK